MIPRAHITAWRARAPWSTDAQVEQDLVVSRALGEIFTETPLATELAFRGGTAIHKLFLDSPGRHSEDIDLVQVNAGAIGSALNALRARLDPWLGKPVWRRKKATVTLTYRYLSEIEPVTPLKLKVEINTREHFSVLPLERRTHRVDSPWYAATCDVVTYAAEEILGTKLRALYQRKKGRDLFDLAEALMRLPNVDTAKVIDCFDRYLEQEGLRVSRAEFEANVMSKIKDPAFTHDVTPLLAQGVSYDPNKAMATIMETLVSRMPGEPWKEGSRK